MNNAHAGSSSGAYPDAAAMASLLLCLDCRAGARAPGSPQFTPGAEAAAPRLARLLAFARAHRWRVAHSFCEPAAEAEALRRPMPGFEPLRTEAIYPRPGLSAFSNPDFFAFATRSMAKPKTVYVVGFAQSAVLLATVFSGLDLGLEMAVVEDAVAAPRMPSASGEQSESYESALLRPFAWVTGSDAVIAGRASNVVRLSARETVSSEGE